jgi:hypothetical protein
MKRLLLICMALALAVPAFSAAAQVQDAKKKQDKIANAMSAGPLAITKDATILDYSPEGGGPLVELRKGNNGWTCLPDWSVSPGNDPECLDETWMKFMDDFLVGNPDHVNTSVGLAYMLQGGSDPSNTDPYALAPAPGEHWVNTGPHLMVIAPGRLDMSLYSTDPYYGGPHVMWAGTPYEHFHMPVPAAKSKAAGEQP